MARVPKSLIRSEYTIAFLPLYVESKYVKSAATCEVMITRKTSNLSISEVTIESTGNSI